MTAIEVRLQLPIADAEAAVRQALASEGFGVLTEIDVAATFKAKLGVERPPLRILGACNPGFAHRALAIEPAAALVMPCNVVLEQESPSVTKVMLADPSDLMPGEATATLAAEASERLSAVAARLREPERAGR